MNTTQRNLAGLMALALLIAMAPMNQASATVRVRASVKTPHLTVRVDNTPRAYNYSHIKQRHNQRRVAVRIDKQDRRIAKRLARVTAYSKRELLGMRRDGLSWNRIGRYLNLRPQVVRAAKNAASWERYLHGGQRRHVRCATR